MSLPRGTVQLAPSGTNWGWSIPEAPQDGTPRWCWPVPLYQCRTILLEDICAHMQRRWKRVVAPARRLQTCGSPGLTERGMTRTKHRRCVYQDVPCTQLAAVGDAGNQHTFPQTVPVAQSVKAKKKSSPYNSQNIKNNLFPF
ncbi:hypothetical protein TRVL_04821 [Trypanosoma vivax]|nr:hypothetical protein TRVL_04821 [Trypanosoma vivax]